MNFKTSEYKRLEAAIEVAVRNEYKEIKTFMVSQSITPIGISPKPPDLKFIAKSYGIEFKNVKKSSMLSKILSEFRKNPRTLLIEITENRFKN